jgi:hypothetical protein
LRNEAKRKLDALRAERPAAKLTEAQFLLAREYGFASWRELKAELDRSPSQGPGLPDPAGDWIADVPTSGLSVALHVAPDDRGGWRASFDVPRQGHFDDPVEAFRLDDDRLSFEITVRGVNARYEAAWDATAQLWRGTWAQSARTMPLDFRRGVLPPAQTVEGLDGLWDGRLEARGGVRLTFRVRTDARGTAAWLQTSKQPDVWFPAAAVRRDGDAVAFVMQTLEVAGRLASDGATIAGRWRRDGVDTPVVLSRRAPGGLPPRGPTPERIDLPVSSLAAYAGRYVLGEGLSVTLGVVDGDLRMLDREGAPTWELVPTSLSAFFLREVDGEARFELDKRGRPTALMMAYGGRETRYRRVG